MSEYQLNTEENRAWMQQIREDLLDFGKHFPSPGGSAYYLGDDGTPWKERPRETWITSRMAHVYAIGAMLGWDDADKLSACAVLWVCTQSDVIVRCRATVEHCADGHGLLYLERIGVRSA